MKVMTKIYRSWLNCQVDTCTDEGLETSDHFSSYRLSLKLKPLSRLRWRGGVYCDSNALYCAALRDRTESKGKQVKEGKGTKKKKLRQTRL